MAIVGYFSIGSVITMQKLNVINIKNKKQATEIFYEYVISLTFVTLHH
jgi:hypothetical protein